MPKNRPSDDVPKYLILPAELVKAVADFRYERRIKHEKDAYAEILRAGLSVERRGANAPKQ